MVYDKDWTHAEDLLQAASADLRSAADKLEAKAIELEDQAYCCRKRRFERSQSPTSSDLKWRRTNLGAQEIEQQVRSSASSFATARVIRDHVKSINSAIDENGPLIIKGGVSGAQQATAPCILGACSMITDRFAERLVQVNKRQKTQSVKPLSIHQKYVNEDGQPIYASPECGEMGIDTLNCWTAVNGPVHKCPANTTHITSTQAPADRAADASLLQHVSQQGGVQRSIIMRAANRLAKHEDKPRS